MFLFFSLDALFALYVPACSRISFIINLLLSSYVVDAVVDVISKYGDSLLCPATYAAGEGENSQIERQLLLPVDIHSGQGNRKKKLDNGIYVKLLLKYTSTSFFLIVTMSYYV